MNLERLPGLELERGLERERPELTDSRNPRNATSRA
jgi:hypothetical protein